MKYPAFVLNFVKKIYRWKRKTLRDFLQAVSLGSYLAYRQIKRSNKWTTALIIFVMTLTFLNLVVISGILVGLIQGASDAVKSQYMGDLFISTLNDKKYIENTPMVVETLKNLPWVESVSSRYNGSITVEANYKSKVKATDKGDSVSTVVTGIDPQDEDAVTGLGGMVLEGEYLNPDDYDKILIGSLLLRKYFDFDSAGFATLKNANVGDRVRVTINGTQRDVTIKGIVKTKTDEVSRKVFFVDKQLRGLIGRDDHNATEIAVILKPGTDPKIVKEALTKAGVGELAKVQTFEDAEPKFVKDLKTTFSILGNVIGSIGLTVASITIFIVIFINAITRRKFIGILKGIGIKSRVIEYAYVMQSIFYAALGTFVGMLLVFFVIKPYFNAYPINFPFSDGILVATPFGTAVRAGLLFIATLIAGYIPAKIVVRQNTLDAILGR